MGETLRFQPNNVWDDSWVLDEPEVPEEDTANEVAASDLIPVPDVSKKKEWR